MRLITIDRCKTGMRLAKSIFNVKGTVLLTEGTELSNILIEKLKKYNVFTVYIEDDASEGIEIVESIPQELLNEAVNVITDGLQTIASLKKEKMRAMMKSERTIRSFQKIFRDIVSCLGENQTALNLLATTKIHENYLYTHSLNVSIYSCQLAIENGLPIKNIEEIGLGAMLHDLGKMYISPEILKKPGRLTEQEFEQVKMHCELGFDVLRKIHEIPLPVSHCAFQHHERIDGSGYPRQLKGDEIHKYAKIVAVADVFDAVTSHRSYRTGMLPHKGMELLYAGSNTHFDSRQVQLFKNCIAIYPQGVTLKLSDGRTGIVSKYNFHSVGRPIVRIIKDEHGQDIQPIEIDLSDKKQLAIEIIEADAVLL